MVYKIQKPWYDCRQSQLMWRVEGEEKGPPESISALSLDKMLGISGQSEPGDKVNLFGNLNIADIYIYVDIFI